MKVDFSYIDTILKVIENKTDLRELECNVGYQTIRQHANITGNEFSLVDIKNAIDGVSDKAYGLRNLMSNVQKIKDLYKLIKLNEREWLGEVEMHVANLINYKDYDVTTIYPVIGYDIGIGINKTVCVNLNSEICLNDFKELISIIIHEVTHTYYDEFHGLCFDADRMKIPDDMMNYLTAEIQYEGVGVFSAYEYRNKHNLSNVGSRIQEDYSFIASSDKGEEIINEYKRLTCDMVSGEIRNNNDFISRVFGKAKLPHRLGYNIFTEIYINSGVEGVRKAVRMSNKEFFDCYLSHHLIYSTN